VTLDESPFQPAPMKKTICLMLATAALSFGAERATFDSAGRVTSLIDQGHRIDVLGHFVLTMDNGRELILQPHDQRSPIERKGARLQWEGSSIEVPGVRFTVSFSETADGLALDGSLHNGPVPRHVRSVDYVLALPRDVFLGGQVEGAGVSLPAVQPTDPAFHRAATKELRLHDAAGTATVFVNFESPRETVIVDTWNSLGRWYDVRVPLRQGTWNANETLPIRLTLGLRATPPARLARLTIDAKRLRQPFLGFGANYCWVNTSPVVDYTLEHLKSTWLRFELKFGSWIAERDDPGPLLRRDFELMQRAQRAGIPWIISLWRVPEDYYVPREPGASPLGHGRKIALARWDDFLEGIGSFLLYVKQHYGAEPDMFSFNEPDLGVDIVFTGEEHRDAIKMIGAHFEKLGLKTKQLLGETANPRDRHLYVLPTAADPEAMKYVAGVSFHSWGGASPEQYAAWGDVAEWLQRPLFVGEAGMDPGAYRNRTYDSYTYGLRELKDHFDAVLHARAQVSLYWQYTNDYGLVRVAEDGTIEPTGRFHLMRHLSNLTPPHAQVITARSDQPDVHVMGFRSSDTLVVHVLNTGPACGAELSGLPTGGVWRITSTTETAPFQEQPWMPATDGLEIPARSMITLVRTGR
jgi:hypothetical protein